MKHYPHLSYRTGVWQEIVRYIGSDILTTGNILDTCVELGAGYCDFINQFPALTKICYEQNKEMEKFALPDIDFRCQDAVYLSGLEDDSIDLLFASNFLEHLNDKEHEILLPRIYDALKQNGKLVLIQPNYRLCSTTYFDDETHQSVFDDINIQSFLVKYGFEICKITPGLLPFSMKSRMPKWPILVRLYLNSPIRPNSAQMYVIAQKR